MSKPYLPLDELSRVLRSFVKNGEAISQNTASDSTTPSAPTQTPSTSTSTPVPSIGSEADPTKEQDLLGDQSQPQTYDEAINQLSRLRVMRDALLEEKSRNDKFVSRYQEKVAKAERIATLKQLIPREIFTRQDRYDQEIEKVLEWQNVSDDDIREIYKSKTIRQHGSSILQNKQDPYRNFRDVPDFSKIGGKPLSSSTNDVLRNLEFMKKIAGSDIGYGNYH